MRRPDWNVYGTQSVGWERSTRAGGEVDGRRDRQWWLLAPRLSCFPPRARAHAELYHINASHRHQQRWSGRSSSWRFLFCFTIFCCFITAHTRRLGFRALDVFHFRPFPHSSNIDGGMYDRNNECVRGRGSIGGKATCHDTIHLMGLDKGSGRRGGNSTKAWKPRQSNSRNGSGWLLGLVKLVGGQWSLASQISSHHMYATYGPLR